MGLGEALQIKMLEGKSGEDVKELETAGKVFFSVLFHFHLIFILDRYGSRGAYSNGSSVDFRANIAFKILPSS